LDYVRILNIKWLRIIYWVKNLTCTYINLRIYTKNIANALKNLDQLAFEQGRKEALAKKMKILKSRPVFTCLFIETLVEYLQAINPLELAMEALKEMQSRFYRDFPPHPKEQVYGFATPSTMKPTQWSCKFFCLY
jgi:hypothetical protein